MTSPLPPPAADERHGRPSLEEVNDQLPPLVGRARFNTGSFRNRDRKMLISTHSDADSAVSMVSNWQCVFSNENIEYVCGKESAL